MRLAFSESDNQFRAEVRSFLETHLPPELQSRESAYSHVRRAECREWQRIVAARGWAAPNWPPELGGTGWDPVRRHIWEVEYGRAAAPELSVIGIGLVGPVLCRFGDEDMQKRYLQPILDGDIYFCQGFSEPQAGSDLASVRTTAVRQGDEYVINGQKIWTSHAEDADFMVCLCRTNPDVRPQSGLSMLIVPMNAPGVTVRVIPTIDDAPSVSEVFLDNVTVSARELIGEENKAWTYAKYLLNTERTHNAYIGVLRRFQDRLQSYGDVSDAVRRKISLLEIDIDALEWSVLRVFTAADGSAVDAAASALKVTASHLLLRAADLEVEILGEAGLVAYGEVPPEQLPADADEAAPGKASQMFYWRAASIFGGANEIQKSIIWKSLIS